jgi:hypothetical protein
VSSSRSSGLAEDLAYTARRGAQGKGQVEARHDQGYFTPGSPCAAGLQKSRACLHYVLQMGAPQAKKRDGGWQTGSMQGPAPSEGSCARCKKGSFRPLKASQATNPHLTRLMPSFAWNHQKEAMRPSVSDSRQCVQIPFKNAAPHSRVDVSEGLEAPPRALENGRFLQKAGPAAGGFTLGIMGVLWALRDPVVSATPVPRQGHPWVVWAPSSCARGRPFLCVHGGRTRAWTRPSSAGQGGSPFKWSDRVQEIWSYQGLSGSP